MEKDKVLVAGCGISGQGAARMLLRNGEDVILYDSNKDLVKASLLDQFENVRPQILLGELDAETIDSLKLCVISPGIPLTVPFVKDLMAAQVPVIGELEAAYRCGKGRLAAITGTNGKTTTTALVGEIFAEYYDSSFVVGNIGRSYADSVYKMDDSSVTVAEVSSFQLESTSTFHPNVSAILNITPDHLDRHGSMEEYIRVKELIAANQDAQDTCVLNHADPVLADFGRELGCRVIFFDSTERVPGGLYLDDGMIMSELSGAPETVVRTDELNILGVHNHENAMAAIGVAYAMGVPVDVIRGVLRSFKAVEHRIEFVTEIDGIAYYDDSKATNPDAAIRGIRAMNRPTVLIGGGYDKGSVYDEWIGAFDGKVKKLILIGQTAEKIAACADSMGFTDYCFADSLEEAMQTAAETAVCGDAVLLSPACASWGMFKNYMERGNRFKELAMKQGS